MHVRFRVVTKADRFFLLAIIAGRMSHLWCHEAVDLTWAVHLSPMSSLFRFVAARGFFVFVRPVNARIYVVFFTCVVHNFFVVLV